MLNRNSHSYVMRLCRYLTLAITLPLLLSVALSTQAKTAVKLDGELRKWHKITLTFDGPKVSENDKYNPFYNYRLNLTFTHTATGETFLIPGYFAADGNAGETAAAQGNKWRAHFNPNKEGEWTWSASFRKNRWVAVSAQALSGVSGGFMDNQNGKFTIKRNNKKAPDFRSQGRLEYINEPYLRFAETQKYFIKAGPDAPENFLSFRDFDGTFHEDSYKDHLVKTWDAHVQDWKKGDPTWQKGKGKGIIGALNYLASKGLNSVSFLTLNILGDDQNVFPYVDYNTYDRFDVSKLDQWEVVFAHAQKLGLFLHFKTQEHENQGLLDGGGTGAQRKLYYRELIARFGHHLALNWNLGEENGEWVNNHPTQPQDTSQRLAMARYFHENDPYHHHVVIHNGADYTDITGLDSYYTGASVQTHHADFHAVHESVRRLRDWPAPNGRPLAVAVDEPGDAEHALMPDDMNPEHNNARQNGLWSALLAGAWGTEWYFGYANPHSDLTCEDYRSRDKFWDMARHSINFFDNLDVPFQEASSHDELVRDRNTWVLAKKRDFYIVFRKDASKPLKLEIKKVNGAFRIQWYDPRNGGPLVDGTIKEVNTKWVRRQKNTVYHNFGTPPKDADKDWVALITRL